MKSRVLKSWVFLSSDTGISFFYNTGKIKNEEHVILHCACTNTFNLIYTFYKMWRLNRITVFFLLTIKNNPDFLNSSVELSRSQEDDSMDFI